MKKFFAPLVALLAWPLFSSCTEYGVYGSTSTGYSSGYGGSGYSSGYSSYPVGSDYGYNYAPLQVGFIATSYSRWAYDPYRACYYDRHLRRYYNYRSRSYYTSVPPRYGYARYPSGYRHGRVLDCPAYLPRHSNDHRYSHRDRDRYQGSSRYPSSNSGYERDQGMVGRDRGQRIDNSRGGSARPSDRGGSSRQPNVVPTTRPVPNVAPSFPSRPTPPPRQTTRPTRLETVNTSPSINRGSPSGFDQRGGMRQPNPVVRSTPTPQVRQAPQVQRSVPSRQTAPSRSEVRQPVAPSRSEARQPIPSRSEVRQPLPTRGRIR